MNHFQVLIAAVSAVVLFLYSLQAFSRELQAMGGAGMQAWLARVTTNRWYGFLVGAIATALVQSSSATTALAVALVDAQVISFAGSLAILLGANVGTTATAWLVSMKLTGIGPLFIIAGALVSSLPSKIQALGKAAFYFGLIFFALDLISSELKPLQAQPWFVDTLAQAREPWIALLMGALFTALVQSSSVSTGLAIVLTQHQLIPAEAAIAIVVGANVGSTSTALLSSLQMSANAQATAKANFLFNLAGALAFFPFIPALSNALLPLAGTAVAAAHLIFNLCVGLCFLVFLPYLQPRLMRWLKAAPA
ncbi:Na/Pi symporter [Janthinobacterium sp. GMG1]|uniref:Na/Pi cotransporter family protein n=1 Tax=Janthinobacterium sp. GMG1 TaxID=3096007 RepID=UPI002ACA0F19|nr:Na/Pi symporter [Janthinobacterium sp. GMG1]MDZ5634152.1 Na/Pi symporter [Janthinobacterium sp. GMG1]